MTRRDLKKDAMVLLEPGTSQKIEVKNLGTIYENGRISGAIIKKIANGEIFEIPSYNFVIWEVV